MKLALASVITLTLAPCLPGQVLHDDFESGHTLGSPPAAWDTKFDPDPNNLPLQQKLFTVQTGVGRDMTQGLSLDVTKAKAPYMTKSQRSSSGTTLILSADFQVTTTGQALADAPTGQNQPLIGLLVSTSPDAESLPRVAFSFIRRSDDYWGLFVPQLPFAEGYVDNSAIGLGPGLTASTSDWFTILMHLTDTGAHWEAFAEVRSKEGSLPLSTTTTFQLPASFAPGLPLYGGVISLTGDDTNQLGAFGKVSAITVDNFAFGPPGLAITSLTEKEVVRHSFTSVTGKNHRLQYSLDGTHFYNTGASVAGDGTVKSLSDPAADTNGRSYRVTSD